MNLVHTCLFHKVFCTVFSSDNEQNAMTLLYRGQHKNKNEKKSKSQKQVTKNKVYLELLRQRLGHRFTRSILSVDIANGWKYNYLRVVTDHFCT